MNTITTSRCIDMLCEEADRSDFQLVGTCSSDNVLVPDDTDCDQSLSTPNPTGLLTFESRHDALAQFQVHVDYQAQPSDRLEQVNAADHIALEADQIMARVNQRISDLDQTNQVTEEESGPEM